MSIFSSSVSNSSSFIKISLEKLLQYFSIDSAFNILINSLQLSKIELNLSKYSLLFFALSSTE